MALYDEVVRTPGYIQGDNFTALADFVTLLSNHFPVLSFTTDSRRAKRTSSTVIYITRPLTNLRSDPEK